MRHLRIRPLIALVALVGLAPSLAALTVEDEDLKLSLVLNLQTRIEAARANDAAGGDYDVQTNTSGKPDTADFYLRRFRPGFKGTYQDDWYFAAILNADNSDRSFSTAPSASNGFNRTLDVHQAYAGRTFKTGSVTIGLQGGLDYAFFNMANAANSVALFPSQRASQALLPVRGTGAGLRVATDALRWGADVQNNTGDSAGGNGESSEGLCYTTRLELTGPGDLALKRWQETYLDRPGIGYILGVEAGINQNDRTPNTAAPAVANSSTTTPCWGIDLVFHAQGLNALAEWREAEPKTEPDAGGETTVRQRVVDAQIGYAFAAGSVVLEPAVRYTRIDLNRGVSETAPFSGTGTSNDFGTSGKQWDVGLNCYFNGHGNKLQLAYTRWTAESGDADANIVRLQHQLNF